MLEKKFVRRYWLRDLGSDRKEVTAVTKSFEEAVSDIMFVLKLSRNESKMKLLKKGVLESKNQAWVLLSEERNPFDYQAPRTKL